MTLLTPDGMRERIKQTEKFMDNLRMAQDDRQDGYAGIWEEFGLEILTLACNTATPKENDRALLMLWEAARILRDAQDGKEADRGTE